jgi:dipeptidyl-peptidase-3
MGELLMQLQVRKSTADAEGAKTFYEALTKPRAEWIGELRELVLFKKQVRGRRSPYVGQR